MPITSIDLKQSYPWLNINQENYETEELFNIANSNLDLELTGLISIYSTFIDENKYGVRTDLLVGLMVAHHKQLDDLNCLRIATALKQLESGRNLSLDNVFVKSCGCDDAWLNQTTYGQLIISIKEQYRGLSMFYI